MWLVEKETAHLLAEMIQSGKAPTSEQIGEYVARCEAHEEATEAAAPRSLVRGGNTARLQIRGLLTDRPNLLAMLFGSGNTTYQEISRSLDALSSDESITDVEVHVASVGGHVDGLFEALASVEKFRESVQGKKNVKVFASKATSAAYALATMFGKIEATSPAATFGSIGVAGAFAINEKLVEITSTEAPEKRPDLTTEEGKASVRKYMDGVHELFVSAIASARSHAGALVTSDEVNSRFGRGASLLAREAQAAGMIDSIANRLLPAEAAAKATQKLEPVSSENAARDTPIPTATEGEQEKHMELKNLQDLQAHNPDLYEAAVKLGEEQERDRVNAHLINGQSCGAMDIALAAIEDGSPMTQTLQAKYNAAGRNKADKVERQESTDEAAKAAKGADETAPAEKDLGDAVVAILKGEVS